MSTIAAVSRPARLSRVAWIHNAVTGEALDFVKTAADTGGAYLEFNISARPGFSGPPRHVHPHQEECFTVFAGRLGVEVNGQTGILGPGDEAVIPAGQPHTWWVEGEEIASGQGRVTPALHFTELLSAITRSANENGSEMPSVLDAAIILGRYRREYHAVFLPLPIRSIGLPLLALVGRLKGRAAVIDGWINEHYQ